MLRRCFAPPLLAERDMSEVTLNQHLSNSENALVPTAKKMVTNERLQKLKGGRSGSDI